MGMSLVVKGYIPPDADYMRKANAWRACKEAGVEAPKELLRLFDGREPQAAGMEIDITVAVTECRPHESAEGFDIELARLPPGVRVIRVYSSW
jgi:hypothetical protein